MASVTRGQRSPPRLQPSITSSLDTLGQGTRGRVLCSASIQISSMRSADHCITASSPPINTKISSSGTLTSLTLARDLEQRMTFWSILLTLETTKTNPSPLIITVIENFVI